MRYYCTALALVVLASGLAAQTDQAAADKPLFVKASGAELTRRLEALVKDSLDLTSLWIDHPGNKIELRSLTLLAEFKKLETLKLTGDPFLYDDEFKELGKLSGLRSLSMALP